MPFEASQAVFRSLSDYKKTKTTQNAVYRSTALRPSIQDAKYQLLKLGHVQKAKFRDYKVTQQFQTRLKTLKITLQLKAELTH